MVNKTYNDQLFYLLFPVFLSTPSYVYVAALNCCVILFLFFFFRFVCNARCIPICCSYCCCLLFEAYAKNLDEFDFGCLSFIYVVGLLSFSIMFVDALPFFNFVC
jgi:hypothetical protein